MLWALAAHARVGPRYWGRAAGGPGPSHLGQPPHLVAAAKAVPDLQPGAVGGAHVFGVEAPARLRVTQRAVALGLPHLGAGAVAVPQLDERAVGGAAAGDVKALSERPQRRVGTHRPALCIGAVAGPLDVDALAADAGDLSNACSGSSRGGVVDGCDQRGGTGRVLRELPVHHPARIGHRPLGLALDGRDAVVTLLHTAYPGAVAVGVGRVHRDELGVGVVVGPAVERHPEHGFAGGQPARLPEVDAVDGPVVVGVWASAVIRHDVEPVDVAEDGGLHAARRVAIGDYGGGQQLAPAVHGRAELLHQQ